MTQWWRPRQIQGGRNAGKWHYTCGNTSGTNVFAVGGCAQDCPGHDTEREALVHFVDSVAAGEFRQTEVDDVMRKCVECGEFTRHVAMLWEDPFVRGINVCRHHDVRAVLKRDLYERYGLTPAEKPPHD